MVCDLLDLHVFFFSRILDGKFNFVAHSWISVMPFTPSVSHSLFM